MIHQPKGNKTHKTLGWIYFFCMTWIACSSLLSMLFFRFYLLLFAIAIFTFHLVYSGVSAIRIKRTRKIKKQDFLVAWLTLGFGLILVASAIYWLINKQTGLAILSGVFGCFIAWSGVGDLLIYKKIHQQKPMWWWFHHMRGMLGSYIAAFTAFLVQNSEHLSAGPYILLVWFGPGVIGGFGIAWWSKYYRNKFKNVAN